MRLPTALRSLDDRVLGDRGRRHSSADDGAHDEPYPEDGRPADGDRAAETTRETTRETKPRGGGSSGDGMRQFLAIFTRVARAVFLLLALIVILGIVFILAPTNADNVLVDNVLDLADTVAGPFRDVFTADDAEREMVVNYALAAAVYLLAATLVRKLAPSTK